MSRITIGIPCFKGVEPETLEDYMRFAYYLGRRYTEHEFFLAIKPKSEQFRARNAIVEAALQAGSDYLLMLDDDHVIDYETSNTPSSKYEFLRRLLAPFEDQSVGIVGALYYQRGGEYRPVVMAKSGPGYRFLRDDEIKGTLQPVDVSGGGCLLINCKIFDKIPQPYFQPENQFGTDIQICRLATEAGFKVYCDTGVVLGHVMSQRTVVTPSNRYRMIAESGAKWQDMSGPVADRLGSYRRDIEEYTGKSMEDLEQISMEYRSNLSRINDYNNLEDYYRSVGLGQLARQLYFHHKHQTVEWDEFLLSSISHQSVWHILDFGCGSAPATFELLKKGHTVDYVDVDGAAGYEFLKWRIKKHGLSARAGFAMRENYDFAIFADSLEHIKDWRTLLTTVASKLVKDGVIITNFFLNKDFNNAEHVSMDHDAVREHLTSLGFYPVNNLIWVKMGDKQEAA